MRRKTVQSQRQLVYDTENKIKKDMATAVQEVQMSSSTMEATDKLKEIINVKSTRKLEEER